MVTDVLTRHRKQEQLMFWIAAAFVAGLVIAWNVLPQPAWVKRLYDFLKGLIVRK